MKMDPELHDIMKLCQDITLDEVTKSAHSNPDFTLEYVRRVHPDLENNPTLIGILRHHEWGALPPNSSDTFILDIADNNAAALSRPQEKRGGSNHRIFKLWKNRYPPTEKKYSYPIDIDWILDFLKQGKGFQDFIQHFEITEGENPLLERAEDARFGVNITSLYTHMTLTGRLYRLMQKSGFIVDDSEFLSQNFQTIKYKYLKEWKLQVCRVTLHFPQKPIRSRDTNIFNEMKEIHDKIIKKYRDEVVLSTSDEMLMILPTAMRIDELIKELDFGIWLFYEKHHQFLRPGLSPKIRKKSPSYQEGTLIAGLEETIPVPICEICQMKHATKEWPRSYILKEFDLCEECKKLIRDNPWPPSIDSVCDKDAIKLEKWFAKEVTEDLCVDCYMVRFRSNRLLNLTKWSDSEEFIRVVWVKIKLDFEVLNGTLGRLHLDYLRKTGDKYQGIRFSVVSEFNDEYRRFIIKFNSRVHELFGVECIDVLLNDLFTVRIEYLSDIMKILKVYHDLMFEFFPRFADKVAKENPIRLGLTCSDAKYPFFEHWQLLQSPKGDAHVILVEKGEMVVSLEILRQIFQLTKYAELAKIKGMLENLARIAQLSEKLAEISIGSDLKYQKLKELHSMDMEFKHIITLAKILGDNP